MRGLYSLADVCIVLLEVSEQWLTREILTRLSATVVYTRVGVPSLAGLEAGTSPTPSPGLQTFPCTGILLK